jgi:SP family myo-inositol transporter-like MFS transporter 13
MNSEDSRDTPSKMKIEDQSKHDFEEIENVKPQSNQSDLSNIEGTAASKAAWLISIVVSIGGLLFGMVPVKPARTSFNIEIGYDTGYISAVLVTIGSSLGHELSSNEQEMVTSLTSGGALVGAVGAGLTADRFGRRWPIWGACVLFVIGTVLQTAAYSVEQFAAGRFVVGLGVGGAAMIVPMYSMLCVSLLLSWMGLTDSSRRVGTSKISRSHGCVQQHERYLWPAACECRRCWLCSSQR